ncbi:MAG: hypothetical protein AMJ73_08630 [candidate division Zixibacteria bacterium SM1_73]|nr:MAG: hypothetical protein AMJ73_08630 [candidate division Zixibacteria bacterium SM1_73]
MRSNNKWIFLLVFCVMISGASSSRVDGQKSREIRTSAEKDTVAPESKRPAPPADIDSLLVIHFHPEVQCSCCIKVGIYAKEGLERFYPKAYKDSCIIFREYNIDEDTSTAKKYKIFWSALGFEKFSGKTREFKEIESVWEVCEEREKFLPNFKRELDEFMNETKKKRSEAEDKKKVQQSRPKRPE